MKKASIQIASVLMALVILMSTTSFAVIEHYCGGELVDTSLFSSDEACIEEQEVVDEGNCCAVELKDCCNDIIQITEGFDELFYTAVELPNFEKQIFTVSVVPSYANSFTELQEQFIPFKEYAPPSLTFETNVLNQVFRI